MNRTEQVSLGLFTTSAPVIWTLDSSKRMQKNVYLDILCQYLWIPDTRTKTLSR